MLNSPGEDRNQAIHLARKILEKKPVYLDTETTGLSQQDEIVEIAVLDHDGSLLVDKLVKPSKNIPAEATQIHHITDDMVVSARKWPILWTEIRPILSNRLIAIYNAEFDLRMMRQSYEIYRLSWKEKFDTLDVLDLYARFYGQWDSYRRNYRYQSLANAGKQCKINLPNSHRAKDDVMLTRAVLHYIANQEPGQA